MDQQLEVFIKVAEKKNFSRAAEELHMTQPAVSQYIRTFEEQIGTRLLERTNKYVYLNKAGDIVYHHAKEIVGLYHRMEHLVEDLTKEPRGELKIGASYTFGEYVLPHILAQLRHEFPNIRPSVTIGNTSLIAEFVKKHQLDIGIVEGGVKDTDIQEEFLADDTMHIIISSHHHLVKKEASITINDLKDELWIVREEGSGTRESTEKLFDRLDFHPSEQLTFSSTQSIKEAVEAGLGISLLSQWAVQKELKSGIFQQVKVKNGNQKRKFSMIIHSPFKTKALDEFINVLRDNT